MIIDRIEIRGALKQHADDILRAAADAESSDALVSLEPSQARLLAELLHAAALFC